MRQKHQIELNLGTGASGEAASAAAQEAEARAAKACLERPAVTGLTRRTRGASLAQIVKQLSGELVLCRVDWWPRW